MATIGSAAASWPCKGTGTWGLHSHGRHGLTAWRAPWALCFGRWWCSHVFLGAPFSSRWPLLFQGTFTAMLLGLPGMPGVVLGVLMLWCLWSMRLLAAGRDQSNVLLHGMGPAHVRVLVRLEFWAEVILRHCLWAAHRWLRYNWGSLWGRRRLHRRDNHSLSLSDWRSRWSGWRPSLQHHWRARRRWHGWGRPHRTRLLCPGLRSCGRRWPCRRRPPGWWRPGKCRGRTHRRHHQWCRAGNLHQGVCTLRLGRSLGGQRCAWHHAAGGGRSPNGSRFCLIVV
mmetsp:Transcript_42218/g.117553  ORF Transcript_42218/g.117553 Transcript_42218/m.117553 type:complete len:282 (-) Transcript_42218:902-1747(-)